VSAPVLDPNDWTWDALWDRCRAEVDRLELPIEYADAAAVVVDNTLEGVAMAGIEPAMMAQRLDLVRVAVEVVRLGLDTGELDDGPAYVALRAARG
jgi:hypothetical protein